MYFSREIEIKSCKAQPEPDASADKNSKQIKVWKIVFSFALLQHEICHFFVVTNVIIKLWKLYKYTIITNKFLQVRQFNF